MDRTQPDTVDSVRADPAFAERFAAEYEGRWDPGDALAWRDDPDATLPSGAPSPTARLRGLQHAVYSARTPDAAGTAADELRELTAELDRERAEIDRAVAAASAALERERAEATARTAAGTEAHDGPTVSAQRWLGDRRRVVLAAAGCLAVGALLGAGGAQLAASAARDAARPEPTPVQYFGAEGDPTVAALEQELARAQVATDVPVQPVSDWLREETFRRISVDGFRGSIYLARSITQDVCLVLLPVDGRLSSACVAADEVPTTGLEIVARAYTGREAPGGSDSFVQVRWTAGGAVVQAYPVEPPSG